MGRPGTLVLVIGTIRLLQNLLRDIVDGFADDGSCYQPCKRMKFDSRRTKIDPRIGKIGTFIQLEEKVTVRETGFKMDGITLLTIIGGLIGVGKEFLWILILSFGIIEFTFHFVKPFFVSLFFHSSKSNK